MMLPRQDEETLAQILRELDANDRRIDDLEGIEIPFLEDVQIGGGAGAGRTVIETKTPSGVASVTFSSIDTIEAFRHLQLNYVVQAETSGAEVNMRVRLNGSSTVGDYNWTRHESLTDTSGSFFDAHGLIKSLNNDDLLIGFAPGEANAAVDPKLFAFGVLDFLYKNEATFKVVQGRNGTQRPTFQEGMRKQLLAGSFRDLARIDSIVFDIIGSTFHSGSILQLVGLS